MKQRLYYIDALRGFTMFLVVFWHVMTMTFGLGEFDTPCGYIFKSFRMPMFFFISGFIAYKPLSVWTNSFIKKRIIDKAKIQLIPTIIFFALFHLFHGRNPWTQFITEGIVGYWFTTTLFLMFIVYFFIIVITRCVNSEKLTSTILFLVSLVVLISPVIVGTDWYLFKILNLSGLVVYFQFFAVGVIVHANFEKVKELLHNDMIKTLLIVIFVGLCYVMLNIQDGTYFGGNKYVMSLVHTILLPYVGLFSVFSTFLSLENWVNSQNRLSRAMQFVGRRTLDVYLIHYFIVPIGFDEYFKPIADNSCFVIQFAFISIIAICVLLGCLLISSFIRQSQFLGKNLFGVKYEK